MRRVATMWMLMCGLLVLVGCPGKDEPADGSAAEDTQTQSPPERVSPLEMLPKEQDEPADENASAAPIQAPVQNAVNRIAGRSVFPQAGESFAQPIAAKRLSEEDQFLAPIDESAIPDVVPWTEAKKYIGYEITAEGTIVDIGQSRDGKVNFLNFDKDWRDKFYMVVFDDLAKTLPKSVADTFRGKTIRVKGMVENHRGRPQIKILSMDQVQFVGE